MTYSLRRLVRLAGLFGVALVAALDFAVDRRHRRDAQTRAEWLHRHCRRALRAIGVRCSHAIAPSTRGLIVANHLSYLDILVLAAAKPVVFVAKREVRSWPLWGWLAHAGGTCFVDRQRRGDVSRAGAEIKAALAADANVVVFCEGTSTDGSGVLPFKPALLQPALDAAAPLVPVALAYSVPPPHSAAREVCWWGDMEFFPHLWELARLPHIEAHLAWGAPQPAGDDRKLLAARLHETVSALHHSLRAVRSPAEILAPATASAPAPAFP